MSDSEDTDGSGVVEWPVSKEWLENILKIYHSSGTDGGEGEGPKVTVEDFEVSPGCVSGESVLSDILAVAVDYTLDGQEVKLKVIVKLLPQDPFSRFFVTEAQFDLREIKFYTQVNFYYYCLRGGGSFLGSRKFRNFYKLFFDLISVSIASRLP